MDSPGSSPEPADWDILPVDAHSELSQQADAYAASSQPVEAAVQPISSDNQSQQSAAEVVTQLMPLDELPTFELPGEADWQADREAAGGAAAAAAMSVVQHAAAVQAVHESHMQPDTQLQQHWQAQQASSAPQSPPAAAAAGREPLPVALPHIDEAAVDALRTALQQQDDQQLLQEAAAVGGRGSVPTAADTDAMGLPGPQLSDGDGCQREPESSAVSQLQHLDLQDRHQQQQRQQQLQAPSAVPQKQQQQQHGQLDLDELLQPGSGGGSMDLDRDTSADIPVLQQPQRPRTQHDAAYAVLPPGAAKQPWPCLDGLPGGAAASVHRVVGEGLGPQDFGLPVEAPPVLPDEPAKLLQVPEQPADRFLL